MATSTDLVEDPLEKVSCDIKIIGQYFNYVGAYRFSSSWSKGARRTRTKVMRNDFL